jgi:hypothetical protein
MLLKLIGKKSWRSCGYKTGLAEGCACVLGFDGTYGAFGGKANLEFSIELNKGEEEHGGEHAMIVYSDQLPGYGYATLDKSGWNGHSTNDVPPVGGATLLEWLTGAKEGDSSNKINIKWKF